MRYRLLASYQGAPYEAGIGPDEAGVVLFAACPPPEDLHFEPATGHWRKRVSRADVQTLYESRPVGMFRGEPCVVLDDLTDRLHIAYLGHDAYRAEQLGYWEVDRGVFELITPRQEVPTSSSSGCRSRRLAKSHRLLGRSSHANSQSNPQPTRAPWVARAWARTAAGGGRASAAAGGAGHARGPQGQGGPVRTSCRTLRARGAALRARGSRLSEPVRRSFSEPSSALPRRCRSPKFGAFLVAAPCDAASRPPASRPTTSRPASVQRRAASGGDAGDGPQTAQVPWSAAASSPGSARPRQSGRRSGPASGAVPLRSVHWQRPCASSRPAVPGRRPGQRDSSRRPGERSGPATGTRTPARSIRASRVRNPGCQGHSGRLHDSAVSLRVAGPAPAASGVVGWLSPIPYTACHIRRRGAARSTCRALA